MDIDTGVEIIHKMLYECGHRKTLSAAIKLNTGDVVPFTFDELFAMLGANNMTPNVLPEDEFAKCPGQDFYSGDPNYNWYFERLKENKFKQYEEEELGFRNGHGYYFASLKHRAEEYSRYKPNGGVVHAKLSPDAILLSDGDQPNYGEYQKRFKQEFPYASGVEFDIKPTDELRRKREIVGRVFTNNDAAKTAFALLLGAHGIKEDLRTWDGCDSTDIAIADRRVLTLKDVAHGR